MDVVLIRFYPVHIPTPHFNEIQIFISNFLRQPIFLLFQTRMTCGATMESQFSGKQWRARRCNFYLRHTLRHKFCIHWPALNRTYAVKYRGLTSKALARLSPSLCLPRCNCTWLSPFKIYAHFPSAYSWHTRYAYHLILFNSIILIEKCQVKSTNYEDPH
jgi:hypothetical protein